MSPFVYQPLPDGEQIRLLTISPGGAQEDIVLSIQAVNFARDAPPFYHALSYIPGSADDPEPVTVSSSPSSHDLQAVNIGQAGTLGTTLMVTKDLAVALRHLRLADKPRIVWIDGISIDHANDVEKARQVAMMGDIFRLAAQVVAWLGEADKDSDHALEVMRDLGSQVMLDRARNTLQAAPNASDPSLADISVMLTVDPDDLNTLCHLLCREWFDRLWSIPEIFLANAEALVMCGTATLSWATLVNAFQVLLRKPRKATKQADAVKLNNRIGRLKDLFGISPPVPLISLRKAFGRAECDDPRDRIFAITPLLDDNDSRLCKALDYTKPAHQIYEEVTLGHIAHYGHLEILRQCDYTPGFSGPSWVPDWSRMYVTTMSPRASRASSQLTALATVPRQGTLRVSGAYCTTVEEVHPIGISAGHSYGLTELLEKIRNVLPDSLDGDYVAGGSLIEAYAKTLLTGEYADNFWPEHPRVLGLERYVSTLQRLLIGMSQFAKEDLRGGTDAYSLAAHVRDAVEGDMRLIKTFSGYIGIGPQGARVGDAVCALLGCHGTMLLRPTGDNKFNLVGECYVEGLARGEALLGSLPQGFKPIFARSDAMRSGYHAAFMNRDAGMIVLEDPRLNELPVDLTDFRDCLANKHPDTRLEIDPEVLRARGVDIMEFDLV